MLPARQMESVTQDKSSEMAWETLERLFMEMPQEFQDYLMERFAEQQGGIAGLPETKKMAQLTGDIGSKLGQY